MSFAAAVRSALTQYATFPGRARRSEYWWFVVFNAIVGVAAAVLDRGSSDGPVSTLSALALLLPTLAVSVRRLHDTDRSGWCLLFALIPLIGSIVLIAFLVQDSDRDNRFGQSPKYQLPSPSWAKSASPK
jgi:uncharacterized membrane protein YhaH (DUF805 family)